MNVLLKLSYPSDYTREQVARFLVELDKGRHVHGNLG
jgi:hypothetical protein